MYTGVDAVGPGRQPITNHSPFKALFFVVFVVIANFFIINLFVGVTISTFAEQHEKAAAGGAAFLTKKQQVLSQPIGIGVP